jgi:hypothetical protein
MRLGGRKHLPEATWRRALADQWRRAGFEASGTGDVAAATDAFRRTLTFRRFDPLAHLGMLSLPGANPRRTAIELAIVLVIAACSAWWLAPTSSASRCVAVLVALGVPAGISVLRLRGFECAEESDWSSQRAWGLVGVATGLCAVVLAAFGWCVREPDEPFWSWRGASPEPFAAWLALGLITATMYQLFLHWFLVPACRELLRTRRLAMAASAAVFGLLHLPSPWLAGFAALGALLWMVLHQRTGRLLPLIACQLVGMFLLQGLVPERLHSGLRVGVQDRVESAAVGMPHEPLESRGSG